ncbi:MAG: hypothetical protein FJZ63_04385, partial [Chlamydiae bacterium]|nr:hypothetical protein [Chlamydiota bacterium]
MSIADAFLKVPRCSILWDRALDHPFVTTNERGQTESLKALAAVPVDVAKKVAIGVSGFFILNAVAIRPHIDTLIILDRSQRMERFWQGVEELLLEGEDRGKTLEKIRQLIERELFWRDCPKEMKSRYWTELTEEISQGISWLSDDIKFRSIQQIFQKRHFAFLKVDIKDEASIKAIREVLDEQSLHVDMLYISNIRECLEWQYLHDDHFKARFEKNVLMLVERGTQLIQAQS